MNESNKTDANTSVSQHIYTLTGNDGIKTIDCHYAVEIAELPDENTLASIHDLTNPARNPHSVKIIETTTSTDEGTQQEAFRRSIKRYFIENFKAFRARDILTDERYKLSSRYVQQQFLKCAIKFLYGDEDYYAESLHNRDNVE